MSFLLNYFRAKTPYISDLDLVAGNEYDYIIIGGGTSGCVLASRLSEDPNVKVLLLEAGGSGKAVPLTRVPFGYGTVFRNPIHAFQLYTEPQENLSRRIDNRKFWPRGKLLGGCSSVNAQMAQYGDPGDFDEWARITGDSSWSWDNFKSYFQKFEKYVPSSSKEQIPKGRGTTGPVEVGYFSYISSASKAFIKSALSVGIPSTNDFNGDSGSIGVNRMITYIDKRRTRVSSETAYLTARVLARPNLKVAIHATVTKILLDQTADVAGEAQTIGVQFKHDENSPIHTVKVKRDVIVSAGAVHSPQILLLSGVGKSPHVDSIVPLPGVGNHLSDHIVADIFFKDKSKTAPKFLRPEHFWDVVKLIGAIVRYRLFGTGPFSTNWGEAAAFVRSDDLSLFPPSENKSIESSKETSYPGPDIEIFSTALAYKNHGAHLFPGYCFGLHSILLRPVSKGSITLKSGNPFDHPVIDPKYLEAPEDVAKLVRGVKLSLKIAQTPPLTSTIEFVGSDTMDSQLTQATDQELEELVRERVETVYHPACTCRMAPLAEGGVVDSQFRVYGTKGLRVCDASVFPAIVSGHTAGACFAVAERLADELKQK